MNDDLDYLGFIRSESDRFAQCLARLDPSVPVPTCPDWSAADLLWHLAEVQLFWGAIVRDRLDSPDGAEANQPKRPDGHEALFTLFGGATSALLDALAETPDETAVWTWASEQTAGFVRRRQAHEALIHRLDAELTADELTAIDPDLAIDGVDEVLRVMFGGLPPWGTFMSNDKTGQLETSDTGASWKILLGRWSGMSPNSGKSYDEDAFMVVDDDSAAPAFNLRATARDLDAWLWGRPPLAEVEILGDDGAAVDKLKAIVATGIQ